jgi:hypothetical protein
MDSPVRVAAPEPVTITAPPKIVGAMAVAMVFGVIAGERKAFSGSLKTAGQSTSAVGAGIETPVKVILGGTIATAILVGISELGEPGAKLGVGLAVLVLVVSLLVNGGPVWSLISDVVSSKASQPTPTTPTTPTGATT